MNKNTRKRHIVLKIISLIGMGKSQRYQAAVDGHKAASDHWRKPRRSMQQGVRSRNTDLSMKCARLLGAVWRLFSRT